MIFDPENPYVRDPYFFANVTETRYNQTWMYMFHKLNNYTAFVLGTLTTLLVFYLVLNKTPQQFKLFSRIILICFGADLVFLIVDVLTQFRFRVASSALIFSVSGPFKHLSYWWQCNAVDVVSACLVAAYLTLPFQYMYRFLSIKNKHPPTLFQLLFYFILCVIVICADLVLVSKAYCMVETTEHLEHLWYVETPIPQLTIGQLSNKYAFIHMVAFGFLAFLCYALSIYWARQTIVQLAESRKNFRISQKTYSLQKQFGRALFAQALVPLFTVNGPVLVAVISVCLQNDLGSSGELIMMFITWFPFFNAFCTLFFISPYRMYCLRLLRRFYLKPMHASVSVGPTHENSNSTTKF